MRILLVSLMLSLGFTAQAQTLTQQSFEDQWEKPVELNAQTKWLVVTQSKDAGKMVKETFESLEMKDLASLNLLYIADVSGMPGFITRMFAIPKMQDHAFSIGLINEEGQLATLDLGDLNESEVSVLALDNLQVTQTHSFRDDVAFVSFLINHSIVTKP